MRHVHIDGTRLAPDAGHWRNLGDWQGTECYPEAARQLARTVGQAAGIGSGDRVLDAGCGEGASLALWVSEFQASAVLGMDAQAATHPHPAHIVGRFDHAPLPAAVMTFRPQRIVCVDAAYHASSAGAFLSSLTPALCTGGGLAFTTLVRTPRPLPSHIRLALTAAGIPLSSLIDTDDWRALLTRHGYVDCTVEIRDVSVLHGYSAHIRRRRHTLPLHQRCHPAWWTLIATARLCDAILDTGCLHYVCIGARLRATPD